MNCLDWREMLGIEFVDEDADRGGAGLPAPNGNFAGADAAVVNGQHRMRGASA